MRIYLYNEKLNILVVKTKGTLRITDIINHYNELTNNVTFPNNLKVLIDCRGTQLNIKINEISFVNGALKNALNKYENIQEAILVDKPYETVVATLFKDYNVDLKKYSFKIFYTEDAAKSWLI